jgi:DNA-binding LacI/PurR family transcriptional regulator
MALFSLMKPTRTAPNKTRDVSDLPRAFVSSREVAVRAGVSRSAVSRTFTPGASVSNETRQRVLQAAADLGYHVNHLARGLMRRETGIVCLVAADMSSPQGSRMVRGIAEALQAVGKVAMTISIAGPDDDAASALQKTIDYRADATVVLSGTPAQSIVRTCLNNGQRLILISRDDPVEGPDNIQLDNIGAASSACRAFLRGGCRRLAVVNSELGTPALMARETAFVAAARAVGLEPVTVRQGRVTSYDSGVNAGRRLLTGPERPDAVFAVNDLMACGVMDVARFEFGLVVPDELSIIGFDDIPQAGWLSYALTTFSQPVDQIAQSVVSLISEGGRETERVPARIVLQPEVIWRRTVRVQGN